ncbi:23S rRNA (uracil(1939)-C(5))-methyltransferase RlmD [bacterium]|nr:23S rRNA (uracil(1939)-C(5))-methyltransferase RlmD [bacterium]
MKFTLASKSPRRRELLKRVIDDFEIVYPDIDEKKIEEEDPVGFAVKAAELKAKNVGEKYPDCAVIAADTVVSRQGEIIGKPRNYKEAFEILKSLSGTEHKVITGIAIYKKDENKLLTGYEISYVKFKNLADEEIRKYLDENEYQDKAGGYAVQEIGDKFVEKIKGSYENVVGLPVKRLKRMIEEFKIPEIEVEVEDIAFPNNFAVGKKENFVIFIPGATYKDRVKARIKRGKKNFSYGEVVEILKPSPFRTTPVCPHFGKCGGCCFQNLKYEKQLELKFNYIVKTLEKIGEIDIKKVGIQPIIPSPDIYYYRNKMEFAFGGKEEIYTGLRERNSPFEKYRWNVVPVEKCLIFSPLYEKISPLIIEFAKKTSLPSYDPYTKKGYFRHLILREGKNTKEAMAILVTKSGKDLDFTSLIEKINDVAPEIKSFYWVENDQLSDVVSFEKKHHIFGKSIIEEKINNFIFKISPSSFFQPNSKGIEVLYSKIQENIEEGKRILGLYCGTGAIEVSIAEKSREVVGIDSEEVNISVAVENCQNNNITNCKFYCGRVEKILGKKELGDFDIVIVDPPRSGLTTKAIRKIVKMEIPEFIYVSCNVSTFSRDINLLKENGYKLEKLYPFDLFPHTPHMELLGILKKG